MEQKFSHTDILDIFPEVKARTLITWVERGLIKPYQDAVGRGSSRLYLYTNLIEISIISELHRYSIPFSTLKILMSNEKMKRIFKEKAWDTIFWITNGVTGGAANLEPSVRFARVDDFLKNGEAMIMGAGNFSATDESRGKLKGTIPTSLNASAIVINISSLKDYVDSRLRR